MIAFLILSDIYAKKEIKAYICTDVSTINVPGTKTEVRHIPSGHMAS